MNRRIGTFILASALLISCNSEDSKKKSSGNSASTTPAPGSNSGTPSTINPATAGTGSLPQDQTITGDAIYTGFDGKSDFSLLLPGFRSYTIDDPTIARIETLNVTLSEATINELFAELKQKNPNMDVERFKSRFNRQQTAYRITPLKAGITTMGNSAPGGGGMGTGWKTSPKMSLVVASYGPEDVANGQKRYTTDGGGGTLRACKSCHETGAEGAPPHEMGRVMEISDKDAIQWVTTGKLNGRTAKIQHTWEFGTDGEKAGIVPYLRTRQTHDVEELTKLYFENARAGGFAMPVGGPPGGMTPQASTTPVPTVKP